MKTTVRKFFTKWIVLGLISLLGILVVGLTLAQASSLNQEPTLSPNQQLILELETVRSSATDPQNQQLLDEKIEILKQRELRRSTAMDQPKTLSLEPDFCDLIDDSEPAEEPEQPVGIFDGGRDLISGTQYEIRNFWIGIVNEQVVEADIAASLVDQSQAVVIRYVNSDGGGWFPVPDSAGPLLIVAENDLRLTLEDPEGRQLYFDVPGERFVDSLEEPVPAVEPAPTYTPTPDPCAP